MTLFLTPHALAAAYDYLRATPPFNGWKLPESDAVEFGVTKHRDREGDHNVYQRVGEHIIRASSHFVKTTDGVMQLMAHEMIHMHQEITKTITRVQHNRAFHRLARRVCRCHGWDAVRFAK